MTRPLGLPIQVFDGFLPEQRRAELYQYLMEPGWLWGWRSNTQTDALSFWHKHFAGKTQSDTSGRQEDRGKDCEAELKEKAPIIWAFWRDVHSKLLKDHIVVRSYANGLQYGSDGSLHLDSIVPWSYTSVYYPHGEWYPNWGGETLFYNKDKSDIIAVAYPKPGRLVTFPGTIQHRAAGVSRICPLLRVTLMFKTEKPEPIVPVRKDPVS